METSRRDKINDCLKQFADLSESFKVICTQASMLERSIHSIQDIIGAEVIGREKADRNSTKKSSHLAESLDDFTKILISSVDNIRNEALEVFDNFIIEVISPTEDEIKGIHEHNSQIVVKFHDAFYSIFNHFLVLSAELLEHFLICNECSSPIGFSHQPQCMNATSKPIWRKTKYDDKFITFGMKFSFYDIVSSEYRHNIVRKAIASACWEHRQQQQHEHASSSHKESQQFIPKNWPSRWLRDDNDKLRDDKQRVKISSIRSPYPPSLSSSPDNSNFQPLPLFLLNQWTPLTDDIGLLTTTNFISNPNCAIRQHDTANLLESLPVTSNQSDKN